MRLAWRRKWNSSQRELTAPPDRRAPHDPTYALGRSAEEHLRLQQQAALFRPAIGGGAHYAGYAWLANTLRSLEPLSRKVGVETPDRDGLTERIRDDAVARQLMVWGPPLVGAWVTKA